MHWVVPNGIFRVRKTKIEMFNKLLVKILWLLKYLFFWIRIGMCYYLIPIHSKGLTKLAKSLYLLKSCPSCAKHPRMPWIKGSSKVSLMTLMTLLSMHTFFSDPNLKTSVYWKDIYRPWNALGSSAESTTSTLLNVAMHTRFELTEAKVFKESY